MPMTSAPLGRGLDGPPKTRTPSSACHPPRSRLPRALPVQRETQEVKSGAPRATAVARRLERKAAGLLRMEGQPEPLEPLLEYTPHPLCVVRAFEPKHEVIRISHERTAPAQLGLDLALEPHVEHMVQVD